MASAAFCFFILCVISEYPFKILGTVAYSLCLESVKINKHRNATFSKNSLA